MELLDVRNFVEGYYQYFKDMMLDDSTPSHVKEQAMYRAMLCQDCLNLGKCKICKCKTPAMFFSPLKTDADNKWGPMMEREEWEKYKKEHNIEIVNSFEELTWDRIKKDMNFKCIEPSSFWSGGEPAYRKMNPGFLFVLDILLQREGISGHSVVYSFDIPTEMGKKGRAVILRTLLNEHEKYQFARTCIELGLSFGFGSKGKFEDYIYIDNKEEPSYDFKF